MFDLHVHAAPDVTDRRADDIDTALGYEAAGYTGCVLKAHYESTVGRAHLAGRDLRTRVFGGIALNRHTGGVNPAAVAAALLSGGRVVWMPTADAHTQETEGLPRLCDVAPRLPRHTYAIPPADPTAEAAVGQICALVAEADAVLATGHLSTDEVAWLLPVAKAAGVRRLLLTHPSYTVPAMPARQAAQLCADGAYAEITAYQLLHQPDATPAMLAAFAREVGLDRIVLSSDTGQPDSPAAPEAIELLVDALAGEGLDRARLRACASDIPESLVVPRIS
ncbi:DUF6282 family protein [Pseudonocardia spinosispora]|uniref:DUF6282 family protein n=1 Tax=Pseudonocardia spinosispora TaxID=103441 RepID=UPI0003FDB46A|nr:DUF6282 family protein [Pseudonocardia spinosispora]